MRARIEVDGEPHEVEVERGPDGVRVEVDGDPFTVRAAREGDGVLVQVEGRSVEVVPEPGGVRVDGRRHAVRVAAVSRSGAAAAGSTLAAKVRAPMNGKLDKVLVAAGDAVRRGDVLFVLEAMKMQNEVRSPVAGRVVALHLAAGAVVGPGDAVLEVAPE